MTITSVSITTAPHDERVAWRALVVILLATVMVALDTTIVNVALEEIGRSLGSPHNVEWVASAYLLAVCVSQPASGWLATTFGSRRVLLVSLLIFTLASLACSLAPNLGVLILARVVQGLGGGALIPVGLAMMLGLFKRERHGRAVSVWGMAAMLAPTVGPTVGGWLVTSVGWHWLFSINVPVGIITLIVGMKLLPNVGVRESKRLDVVGLLLGSGGLFVAVLGLSEGNSWGWSSAATISCIMVGIGALGAFVLWELRVDKPLLELRVFANRSFRLATGAMFFVYVAHFGRLVYIPLQLESLRDVSALKVGLLFLPAGVCAGIAMSIGGKLADSIGPRRPILVGCAFMFLATVCFATIQLHTPLWLVTFYLCANSFGMGILIAPALIAGVSELPPSLLAQGTAIRSVLGQAAGAVAVAVLGAVISVGARGAKVPTQGAYDLAFVAAAIGVVISLTLAARLPKGRSSAPTDLAATFE